MRQMTIELDDEEMAQLEVAARMRSIDPERMSKSQLLKLLTLGKKPKWRAGLSARRHQLALKAAWTAPSPKSLATNGIQPSVADVDDSTRDLSQSKEEHAARAKRLALLMTMHGIWKNDPDKPQDGLAYQQEVRAEWR